MRLDGNLAERVKRAIGWAIYDRRNSWHVRHRPPENSTAEEVFESLADTETWSDILAHETADSFDARAANGRTYQLAILPIRHFSIRYYAVSCFAAYVRGLWHSRLGTDYLSCSGEHSLFLGRVRENSQSYKAWQQAQRTRYVLKFDIRAFYPSIRHGVLIEQLTAHCGTADTEAQRMLSLLPLLLRYPYRSSPRAEITHCETGLPIGNTTERFFSNIYLAPLDDYLIAQPDVTSSRRLDDIRVFADDPNHLHVIRERLIAQLDLLGLCVNTDKTKILKMKSSNL